MIAEVEAYLALRRAAGYSMRDADCILRSFGRFASHSLSVVVANLKRAGTSAIGTVSHSLSLSSELQM